MSDGSMKFEFDFTSTEAPRSGSGDGKTNDQRRQEAEARKSAAKILRDKEREERLAASLARRQGERKANSDRAAANQTMMLERAAKLRELGQIAREERQAKRKALRESLQAEKSAANQKTAALDNAFLGLAGRLGLGGVASSFSNLTQAQGTNTGPGGVKTPLVLNLPLPSRMRGGVGGYAPGSSSPIAPPILSSGPSSPPPSGPNGPVPPSGGGGGGIKPPGIKPPIPSGGGPGGKAPIDPTIMLARVFFVLEIAKTVFTVLSATGQFLANTFTSVAKTLHAFDNYMGESVKKLGEFNGVISGALAMQNAAKIQSNIALGRSIQSESAAYIGASTKSGIEYDRLQVKILEQMLPIGTSIHELLAAALPIITTGIDMWKAAGGEQQVAAIRGAAASQTATLDMIHGVLQGISSTILWFRKDQDKSQGDTDLFESLAEFMGSNTQKTKDKAAAGKLPAYGGTYTGP